MKQKKAIRTKDGFRVTHINRRRACRLACIECRGWDESDGDNIRECDGRMLDGTTCSLVDFRDMRGLQNASRRNKALRNFCLECMGGNVYSVSNCTSVYCPVYPYRIIKTDTSVLFDINISDKTVLEMTKEQLRRLL